MGQCGLTLRHTTKYSTLCVHDFMVVVEALQKCIKCMSKHNKHLSHGRMYCAHVRGKAKALQGACVIIDYCLDRRTLHVVKPAKNQLLAIDEAGKDSSYSSLAIDEAGKDSSYSSRHLTCRTLEQSTRCCFDLACMTTTAVDGVAHPFSTEKTIVLLALLLSSYLAILLSCYLALALVTL